ncbi:hypothetical protein SAMN05660453_0048 [Fructobacillus durionis]|uniref:Uncharacterized protein n=1 Tax=Fructobacillus durionis TaxID=283737 RepID=A0A1I1HKR8_9LACO|nr:hypothetical protein SAMN05660453_0048 [Fructobacillus durionis]
MLFNKIKKLNNEKQRIQTENIFLKNENNKNFSNLESSFITQSDFVDSKFDTIHKKQR